VRTSFALLPNYPYGLAFDSSGSLFVSTYRGGSLYKFTPGGGFTSFGSGLSDPFAVACDAAGDVFVADLGGGGTQDGSIYKFAPDGTRTTFATGLDPIGLAFDGSGNLFAADYGSDTIYKYMPDGTRSTFASGVVGHGVFWLAYQVPEPSIWAMLASGVVMFRLRRNR
jgi:DNA-binding beta-propeller fold protein YncE